ncbi:MAG: 4Fe-4S dicluster domain-containing protein [Candidatus Latescibacterota bacterium]|jgi:ferredoxin
MTVLPADQLQSLAVALAEAGYRVVAPVRRGPVVRFEPWCPEDVIVAAGVPVNSVKDVVFPPAEVIGRAGLEGDGFTLEEVAPEATPTVALLVRPCDAAALTVLDRVLGGAPADVFYTARRGTLTVVGLACDTADEHCFCTSVGGAPGATVNLDLRLLPAAGGDRYLVEALSRKGEEVVAVGDVVWGQGEADPAPLAEVPVRFDAAAVTGWLAGNFDHPLWREVSLECLGCGACAFACPSCHCFDVQDEASRTRAVRRRTWDACALGLFTLHASGHNPRPDQSARWRQRVMHKLAYLPARQDVLGCSGCGRCSRLCPNGLTIAEACQRITALAARP